MYDLFRRLAQSDLTEKEREVNQIKSDLLRDFKLTPSYYSVNINSKARDVHIISERKTGEKILLSKPDETFVVGDIVDVEDWNNSKWLVYKVDADNQVQTRGMVLECANIFTVYKNNTSYEIDYVIFDNIALARMGIEENKYLTIPNSRMMIVVADTDETRLIQRSDIYELYNSNGIKDSYRVLDINRARNPGLAIIELDHSSEEGQTPPSYSTEYVIDGDTSIVSGITKTYIAKKYVNGSAVSEISFTFEIIADNVPSIAYTLTNLDNTSCSIAANYAPYTIVLRATDTVNSEYVDLSIDLIKLF